MELKDKIALVSFKLGAKIIKTSLILLLVITVLGVVSHSFIYLEKRTVRYVNSKYHQLVYRLASDHGLRVPQPRIDHNLKTLVYLVQREMKVNELPMQYEPIVLSLAMHESNYGNVYAQSSAGALGLFQVMPGTAKEMGFRPNEMLEMENAVIAGVRYFSLRLKKQKWNVIRALKAYNGGDGGIDKSAENRAFARRVLMKIKDVYNESAWRNLN